MKTVLAGQCLFPSLVTILAFSGMKEWLALDAHLLQSLELTLHSFIISFSYKQQELLS
jgi:hypothetical protein